jgi:hypothetical protein
LLREGLTNEAIARRLGISLDTAKFHVSEILAKLGLSSRQEAARWPGEPRHLLVWPTGLPRVVAIGGLVCMSLVLVALILGPWLRAGGPGPAGERTDAIQLLPGVDEGPSGVAGPSNVSMTVCTDNDEWQRPATEEQATYVDAQGVRYGGFDALHQSQFQASFWFPSLGTDPVGALIDFSGLWTEHGLYLTWDDDCQSQDPMMLTDVMYVWSLGYEATGARFDGEELVVHVEPKAAGFQVAMLQFDDALTFSGPIEFVDSSGRVVEVSGNFDIPGSSECPCRVFWSIKQ